MGFRLGVVLAMLATWPAYAAPLRRADVPEPLRPWIDWVLHGHDDEQCPALEAPTTRECAWPSRLVLTLDEHGGKFTQQWLLHHEASVPLPGDESHWPQQVRVDDAAGVVTARDSEPGVQLRAGTHTVTGTFEWDALPEWLPTPAATGLVGLSINGEPVPFPKRDTEGRLWLRMRTTTEDGEARLDLVVTRLLQDDVPARLLTRLELNVSGKSRETLLAQVLPDGFVPLALDGELPARIEPDGRLRLQLRPGAWTMTVTGRHVGRPTTITLPAANGLWVSEEVWAFEAVPALRAVTIDGVESVDPTQTTLPEEWRRYPAYRMKRGDAMTLAETRRGDAGAQDELTLRRTWWLDFDGGGYSVQDHVTGSPSTAWRLEMAAPLALGRVAVNGRDLPITRLTPDGPRGVELRDRTLDLQADARLDGAARQVPIVGWSSDFTNVSGQLNLPPGWRLFHARGVDVADPSWIAQWSLLDLFLVLVTAMAVMHLYGRAWGALALVVLVLTYPEPVAPRGAWLALLAAEALRRALPEGRVLAFVRIVRIACLVVLVGIVASFALREARLALHPSVVPPWERGIGFMPVPASAPMSRDVAEMGSRMMRQESGDESDAALDKRAIVRRYGVDPAMKVQTGPGTPTWTWNRVTLVWQGPLEHAQEMRLMLVPPWMNRILGFLRIALIGLLLMRMVRDVRLPMPTAAAALVLVAVGLGAGPARAQLPPQPLLDELRTRLLEPPPCGPSCVGINRLALDATGDVLRMRLEVDAAVEAGVALPGSAQDWTPASVLVDGKPAAGIVRTSDGRLWAQVAAGRHDVLLEGRLPPRETVAIPLPEVPHRVTTTLSGWTIAGVREDGLTDGTLQLTREAADERGARGLEPGTLPAFVRITREIHLGLTWDVETTVQRLSPLGTAIVLDVPALDGEAVTTAGVRVASGKVTVSLAPQAADAGWRGVLDQRETIRLAAPADVAWVETWRLDAGPMWHVESAGVPLAQPAASGDRYREWRPWPGESATVQVTRPAGVPGPTLTIDASTLVVRPGLRATDATLDVTVRSSQGGRHRVRLPSGATLGSVTVNGQTQPIRQDGDGVTLPIVPGEQKFQLTWRTPEGIGRRFSSPSVDLGAPSVNATTEMIVPESRWILAVGGPPLGPAVLFWSTLVVIAIAAALLGRTTLAPLGPVQWFLLGIGLSQVDIAAAMAVVGWFLALGWRRRDPNARALVFDARQLALALWTVVMLILLFVAIRQGLLGWPDMQIAGNGSEDGHLRWYADRAAPVPPHAWVFSVPLMVYRLAMLAWAVWAAVALVSRWLPWGWEAFGEGGLWRRVRRKPAAAH